MTYHDKLLDVEEGQSIKVRVVDFENTSYPKEDNPRDIEGEVEKVNEDISHSAGEIQRVITIGDVWDEGCKIDVGDTSKNQLVSTTGNPRKYTKVWRPRAGKDRNLLGEVESVTINE